MPAVLQKHILSRWFCHWRKAAVMTKHFLSASATAGLFLMMSQYLGTSPVEGKLTGKKSRLNELIKRRSGWVHTFKPERKFSFAEPGQAQLQCPIIEHGFSFEQSCE